MSSDKGLQIPSTIKNGYIMLFIGVLLLTLSACQPNEEAYLCTDFKFCTLHQKQPATVVRRSISRATRIGSEHVLISGSDSISHPELFVQSFNDNLNGLFKQYPLHTATAINNSRVLMAGGVYNTLDVFFTDITVIDNYVATNLVNIYNYTGQTLEVGDNLKQARYGHTASLLNNGQVVMIGGGSSAKLETYTPSLDNCQWMLNNNDEPAELIYNRLFHTGTHYTSIENKEAVLIVGGLQYNPPHEIPAPEIFHVDTRTNQDLNLTDHGRLHHTATLLPASKEILIIGGQQNTASEATVLQEVLVFDTANELFNPNLSEKYQLNTPRKQHTATLLSDNYLLVIGGRNNDGVLSTLELLVNKDATSNNFRLLENCSLSIPRYNHTATVIPLNNTKIRVLVCGGYNQNNEPVLEAEILEIDLADCAF